jgi:hypothetical protein
MDVNRVPAPLQERLDHEATAGLLELFADVRKEWTAQVIAIVGDRFERRLLEETSKLRVDMTQGFAAIRQEMAAGLSQVRQEMATGFAALHKEIADQRFELLKRACLFWVGQFFAVAGLAVVIRFLRSGGGDNFSAWELAASTLPAS